jgi:sugar-specific transcriptional regulator TrmB
VDATYDAVNLREIIDSISTINMEENRELLKVLKKYEDLFNGTQRLAETDHFFTWKVKPPHSTY